MNWTKDHQRLFDQLEEVDPVTALGRRRQAVRQQAKSADWNRERLEEREIEKRGLSGWDAFMYGLKEGR